MQQPQSGSQSTSQPSSQSLRQTSIRDELQMAALLLEKCELKRSRERYALALSMAEEVSDLRAVMEAMAGLLRLAGEALNLEEISRIEKALDTHMKDHPTRVPPMAWYCKGAIARHLKQDFQAQRCFHRYIQALRVDTAWRRLSPEAKFVEEAKGWLMLATCLLTRGRIERATWLADHLLQQLEERKAASEFKMRGTLFIVKGMILEIKGDLEGALGWYHKAHESYLEEHHWLFYLYALYAFARIARLQKNYLQSKWYLDLMEKVANGPEFGALKREIQEERGQIARASVDLVIDSRHGVLKIGQKQEVNLRKQYVLLHILEALTEAHLKTGEGGERGLSKAEIIRTVWKENYRPEAHDNKLYYNINRIRKLIEGDSKEPKLLLNWKEGYRLAPDLKVHLIQ